MRSFKTFEMEKGMYFLRRCSRWAFHISHLSDKKNTPIEFT